MYYRLGKTLVERKHLHKHLYEVFPWECNLLEKENNLRQQDIVSLHLQKLVYLFVKLLVRVRHTSGRHGCCHITATCREDKRQFTAPVDTTGDSSEVTSLLPALLDEGHEM